MSRLVRSFLGVAVTLVAACGGGTNQSQNSVPASSGAAAPAAAPVTVDTANAGTVTGKVTFAGTPPAPTPIKLSSDPYCQKANPALATETEVVSKDGAVGNVFVYVKDGLGNQVFPAPSAPVTLDQKGCHYAPHVLGIQVGQPLQIINSDDTLHNVRVSHEETRASAFNVAIPTGESYTYTFERDGFYRVGCDIHPAMAASVFAATTPYTVVAESDGSFTFSDVPTGAWTVTVYTGGKRLHKDVEVKGGVTEVTID